MKPYDLSARVRAFAAPLMPPGSKVLAAVSGGSDSVALLVLLHSLRDSLGLGALGVAHVNHGLRGAESDADEALTVRLAREYGCPCFVEHLGPGRAPATGMESWGREARYRFLHAVMRAEGYTRIVTGHTADDQTETMFMRLARGAGVRGLRGILAARQDGVVRPLLLSRREELRGLLATAGVHYREDHSNNDCRYLRNQFRHKVLPVLRQQDPRCVGSMAETALRVQELARPLYLIVNKWIAENVLLDEHAGVRLLRSGLVDTWVARESVAVVLGGVGLRSSRRHVDAVVSAGVRGRGTHLLGQGWQAAADRDGVVLCEVLSRVQEAWEPRRLAAPGETCTPDGRVVTVETVAGGGELSAVSGDNLCVLLSVPSGDIRLWYRQCRQGEYFWPLGWPEPVRLRAFLKAQRVPAARRERVAVVELAGTGVVWVPGVRVAQQCRVDERSARVLRIRCRLSP